MTLTLGSKTVGPGHPCYVICEIGINHNGDPALAKRLIDAAADAGAQAVKLQKRDVETVYGQDPHPPGYLDQPREHPLSKDQTQRGQKLALEFPIHVHEQLSMYARERGLDYSVSCWDERSLAEVVDHLRPPWLKLASPCVLDGPLVRAHGATGLPLVISTGGLDMKQIDTALANVAASRGVGVFDLDNVCLLHCCSTYPAAVEDLNLRAIESMAVWGRPVGYSGHEVGLWTTLAAVVHGACVIERHLTLNRSSYGSDQAASVEAQGLRLLIREIRNYEAARGDGVKRPRESEQAALRKLRRVVP